MDVQKRHLEIKLRETRIVRQWRGLEKRKSEPSNPKMIVIRKDNASGSTQLKLATANFNFAHHRYRANDQNQVSRGSFPEEEEDLFAA